MERGSFHGFSQSKMHYIFGSGKLQRKDDEERKSIHRGAEAQRRINGLLKKTGIAIARSDFCDAAISKCLILFS
jgi:hypothetical protein